MSPVFDKAVLINLDKRADRLGAFKAKMVGIPELKEVARFRAILGDQVGVPAFFSAGGGAYGCRQSHTRVLEDAILDGVETLWVLEDDCCFVKNFSARLRDFLARLPDDWALLMLGGQHHGGGPSPTGIDGVLRATDCQRTHSYVVRGLEPMRALYRLWMRADTHIDHVFGHFQARFPTYCPDPFLCGQDEGASDIFGRDLPVRFWSKPSAAAAGANRPLALVVADRALAERLRNLGLHYGNDRCPQTGRDRGLIDIQASGWPADRLCAWADLIAAEAADADLVPGFWHDPMPDPRLLTDRLRRPARTVEAATVEEAVGKLPELAPAWRASRVLWCWRGKGVELLEGLWHHRFHRGYHRDEVTGLDQGLRRVVEEGQYQGLRQLVAQLRREAEGVRRGKVLLAHPDLDVGRVRETFPAEAVVELAGAELGELLARAGEAIGA
jgi:hypothetical protein